jgi:hypothetical protein
MALIPRLDRLGDRPGMGPAMAAVSALRTRVTLSMVTG